MSDDEGVTPLQALLRGRPGAGNARPGQRGSGHSVATTAGQPDTELGSARSASWRRGDANSTTSGRGVRQHRSFASWGKALPEKWRAEQRPEPDSGNPTVRDRRGASGNAASWDVLHAARAPDFYLDSRTHGSMRRREATPDQSATAARSPDASRRPYDSAAPECASSRRLSDKPEVVGCITSSGANSRAHLGRHPYSPDSQLILSHSPPSAPIYPTATARSSGCGTRCACHEESQARIGGCGRGVAESVGRRGESW